MDGARRELERLNIAARKLEAEKKIVEDVIRHIEQAVNRHTSAGLGPMTPPPARITSAGVTFSQPDEEPPEYLWQQVRTAMQGASAWTLAEAGERTEQQYGMNLGPLRPQKIRNSVVRHLETFEQLADGRWRVR